MRTYHISIHQLGKFIPTGVRNVERDICTLHPAHCTEICPEPFETRDGNGFYSTGFRPPVSHGSHFVVAKETFIFPTVITFMIFQTRTRTLHTPVGYIFCVSLPFAITCVSLFYDSKLNSEHKFQFLFKKN